VHATVASGTEILIEGEPTTPGVTTAADPQAASSTAARETPRAIRTIERALGGTRLIKSLPSGRRVPPDQYYFSITYLVPDRWRICRGGNDSPVIIVAPLGVSTNKNCISRSSLRQ
jgi:hypothetical protein